VVFYSYPFLKSTRSVDKIQTLIIHVHKCDGFLPDMELIPVPYLLFALYSPIIVEEFFFRAIIYRTEQLLHISWFFLSL